jgi:hypothetical protein
MNSKKNLKKRSNVALIARYKMHFKCWNVTIEIKMLKNESVVDRNLEKNSK